MLHSGACVRVDAWVCHGEEDTGAGPGCCSTNDGLLVVQDTRADSLTLAVVGLPSPTESKLHGVRKTARERRDNILLDDSRDQNTPFKKQFKMHKIVLPIL